MRPTFIGRRWAAVFLAVVIFGAVTAPQAVTDAHRPARSVRATAPSVCLYTRTAISGLQQAARFLGIAPRCAIIFHRAAPDWTAWEQPWFIGNNIANDNWNLWASKRGRRLIITLSLIPHSAESEDWRTLGARGAYEPHARAFARNLVASGLSAAIIRLSNEANGTWFADDLGPTATDRRKWLELWRRTATAMLSVPGARFKFDWTVQNGIATPPLASYYPGDRLVTYIGDDIYDSGSAAGRSGRWSHLAQEPGGVNDVLAFAQAHHKQFSIPEWGLEPLPDGGGDDVAYVNGIAQLTHLPGFAYEGYFFADTSKAMLVGAPKSLAAYRRTFDAES